MKSFLKIIFSLLFFLFMFSCTKNPEIFKENNNNNNNNNNIKYAESELKNALIKNEVLPDKVIPDSQSAVNVAENILFKIYGKEKHYQTKTLQSQFH